MPSDTPQLSTDTPEASSGIPQPVGELNPDTAPHTEASVPAASAPTHEEPAPADPIKEEAIAEVAAEVAKSDPAEVAAAASDASFEADKKVAEKDVRGAIHLGLSDGLRAMGRLPEYLAHELEKLVDYIHAEVTKL